MLVLGVVGGLCWLLLDWGWVAYVPVVFVSFIADCWKLEQK